MNINKTKYLCIGGHETNLKLENNEEITAYNKYKYLGVELTNDGKDTEEIKQRVSQGRRTIKRLNGIWWHEEISRGRKKKIYDAIIKSILLYGAETWRLMEADKRKMTAVEMDALRRSCRVSRRDRIRNDRIREIMGTEQTIIDDIQKKQLIWFGYMKRMDRLPKVAMEWIPQRGKKGEDLEEHGERMLEKR